MAAKSPAPRKTTAKAAAPARKVARPSAQAAPARKAPAPAPLPRAEPIMPAAKPKKPKLVRDSFTIPKAEYAVLDELKQRGAKLGHAVKKSEVLRAGIKALAVMSDNGFLASLHAVPAIKTGRPKLPEAVVPKAAKPVVSKKR